MLFGGVTFTKNADPDKYSYFGYGISFHVCGTSSLPNGNFGKNVVKFGADMSSPVHIDNKKRYSKGASQGLDNTTLTVEAEHSINFTNQGKKVCLSLHCSGSSSYLFVNGVKISKQKILD